jgi:hypothetical protein
VFTKAVYQIISCSLFQNSWPPVIQAVMFAGESLQLLWRHMESIVLALHEVVFVFYPHAYSNNGPLPLYRYRKY